MNLIFFEDSRLDFLPLVYTKPLAELRIGVLKIREKWEGWLSENENIESSFLTEGYLSKKYPLVEKSENIFINARFCPNEKMAHFILAELKPNEAVYSNDVLVVAKSTLVEFNLANYSVKHKALSFGLLELSTITDIFSKNEEAIKLDYKYLTKGRDSEPISTTNTIIGDEVFVEKGAKIEAAILNSTTGPIYIGKDVEIMEGSVVRGPLAMCEHSVLKLATKIYGPTTIGPYSKIGGEVTNSVIQGYSNKGHDGFMGNSIIGEWCNLGADTNISNLKNNYGEVKAWSYKKEDYITTGLQFCGLIMGDHSKCGINTMFNTGTVVGVNANIFGGDFPSKFIPSYSWGGSNGFDTYDMKKSLEVARKVMERRNIELTLEDEEVLTAVFNRTSKYR